MNEQFLDKNSKQTAHRQVDKCYFGYVGASKRFLQLRIQLT